MSENIEVPKEVVEKFNEINLQRKENGRELFRYLAMDHDGSWFAYCNKPTISDGQWHPYGKCTHVSWYRPSWWQNSLTKMPLEDI